MKGERNHCEFWISIGAPRPQNPGVLRELRAGAQLAPTFTLDLTVGTWLIFLCQTINTLVGGGRVTLHCSRHAAERNSFPGWVAGEGNILWPCSIPSWLAWWVGGLLQAAMWRWKPGALMHTQPAGPVLHREWRCDCTLAQAIQRGKRASLHVSTCQPAARVSEHPQSCPWETMS